MSMDEIATEAQHIPLDGDGVPVFLILPPAVQATYDRWMKECEQGWLATDDPAFVIKALTHTYLYRQPPRFWVTEAACTLATRHRTKGYATRAFNAAIRLTRYEVVRDAQRAGRSWDEAYEYAAEVLAPTRAAGESRTMKGAYLQVVGDLKRGRGGLYRVPQMPNRKLSDALDRKQ